MDLAGSTYLYAIAALAMTFVGFCAVVFALRQANANKVTGVHVLHSHGYLEIALGAVAIAMLPPLLVVVGLPETSALRWSSAVAAIGLALHTWYILKRFYKLAHWRFPKHVWVNQAITAIVVAWLLLNAIAVPLPTAVGPIAVAATWRLVMGIEVFLLTFEEFL